MDAGMGAGSRAGIVAQPRKILFWFWNIGFWPRPSSDPNRTYLEDSSARYPCRAAFGGARSMRISVTLSPLSHVVSYGRAGTMLASIERSKRLIDSVPSARGSGGGSSEFVEWSDALSVGVTEIDDQHKELIKMLNKLNTAIHGGWGKETRREVINQLVEYTRVHFTTEESVMSIAGYPDVEAHKKKHHDLILKVKDYVSKYEKNPDASSYDLLFFLKQWLTEHIIKSDKALGDYLLANGPKAGSAKKSWLRRLFGL
jgi:hemerythrin